MLFYDMHLSHRKTPNEQWREHQQAFVNGNIDNTTVLRTDVYEEGYPFDFKFIDNPSCWVGTVMDVTTGLVKNSDDYRSLYFQDLSHDVGRGKYFKWNNNYWICYETTDSELETISTCNIRRCNNWLKWLTPNGEVLIYPCVVDGDISSANAQVAKVITQANSHITIVVQGNPDTLAIKKNERFIINGNVYKFNAINNYQQDDYISNETPLIYMDFYLDMALDEDNMEIGLADDLRSRYHIECGIERIVGQVDSEDNIPLESYEGNDKLSNVRYEYSSDNTDVIEVDELGHYVLKANGEANVTIKILGNDLTTITIPVVVSDTIDERNYNLVVNPIITDIRQGLSVTLTAKVIDNYNVVYDTPITLVCSGTDGRNNYTVVDNGNNSWTITNNKMSSELLTLTFENIEHNLTYQQTIKLRAMF